jgi:hypothetical protein
VHADPLKGDPVAVATVSIIRNVIDPGAVGVTGGTLTAKLSQPGSVLDGSTWQRVAGQVTTTIGAGGALSGFVLTPNDAIIPSGTYYTFRYSAMLVDGTRATWTEMVQLASSPSPIDIGAVPRLGVVPGQAVGSDVSAATVTPASVTTARTMRDLAADVQRTMATRARAAVGVLDLNRFSAKPPATFMSTPVPYFGTELVHPDILFFANGWNGYRYWMAITPYPNADSAYENPSVYASTDGQTWVTPPGGTNPVVTAPPVIGGTYNSDPDFVDGLDGKVYLFHRSAGGGSRIGVTSSSNGITWATPVLLFAPDLNTEQPGSMGIVFDGVTWFMYYVDLRESVTKTIRRRTASSPLGPWSEPTVITIGSPPGGKEFWHLDAIHYAGRIILLLDIANSNSFGGQGDLYLAWSDDGGTTFTLGASPVLARTASGWNASIYRSTFLPIQDGLETRFAIWFSANGSGWHLGYTEASLRLPLGLNNAQPLTTVLDGVGTSYDALLTRALLNVKRTQIADTFNRADSATSPGTPAIGPAWTVAAGTFGISSLQLYQPTAANSKMQIDAGGADKHLVARWDVIAASSGWLMVRYQDSANYLRIGKNTGAGIFRIQKIVAGGATDLWTDTINAADGDWIEIVTAGDSIAFSVNGKLRQAITEATFNTQTKYGVQMDNSTSRLGAFLVY